MNPSFLERFEKYRTSQNTALVCGDTSLTYAELHERCSVLAAHLRERGVGLVSTTPESYDIFNPGAAEHSPWVLIISERSVNALIGIIATWMAGGAYILMGTDAPDIYINNIIEDTAAAVVLRKNDFNSLGDGAGLSYTFPRENEIACAIFTSGSTGKPKGAVLEHRTINEIIQWQTDYMKPSDWTATAAYAPFSFIASLWEFFFPLANGLALHILEEITRHDLFALESYIETHNISYTFLPPNIAEVFTQTYNGSSLKYLRVAGGRLKSCGDTGGRYEIMYHLGMAENGGSVTFKPIREAMSGGISNGGGASFGSEIPIGKPWNRTRVDLLDSTGEMAVSSLSLFRGYLARKEETQNKLVNGRFLSGDLVRLDENGEFIHMGRLDWDVKIRDMKVNPLQVENVLGECTGVTECCVTVQDVNGDNILIAWVAGKTDEESMKTELAAHLSEYMLPSVFIFLDKLPRNINGKVDRTALGYTPPENKNQSNGGLAALFARILGCSATEDDNFLALGGDSLKFMRLQAEIAREYSVNIPYTVLFANPTPRMLNEVLSKQGGGVPAGTHRRPSGRLEEGVIPSPEAAYAYVPIPPAPSMDAYPLSAPMRQMWLLWRTGQDHGKYTVSTKCRFTGEIDKARVIACIEELVKRNAILRSRFVERGGDVFQVIEESVAVSIAEQPRQISNLSATPLFDIVLADNILTFSMHHIIGDAIGRQMLIEDFWTLYGGRQPPRSAQAHEVTLWESGKTPDEAYWRDLFKDDVPQLALPCDFDRPSRLTAFEKESIYFDTNETTRLREYAAARGATLFRLFLAAFALLLSKLSGGGSVVIGVPLAGRRHPDTERTVGNLIRTLPIRLDVSGMKLDSAVVHTCQRFKELFAHQDMSLERLTEIIKIRRSPGRSPFYDVMINSKPRPLPDVCGLHPEILRGDYPAALFDLVLDVQEEKDGVTVQFNYAAELFLKEKIQRWVQMFKNILITPQDALVDVWKSVLGTDEEDFFADGGTSLAAIRMESALFEKGWLLSAADILQNPKRGDMAALMTAAEETDWEGDGE